MRILGPLVVLALFASTALADPGRYALVVGAHRGRAGEAQLAYASRDAHRVADVLVELGGFLSENVVTLDDPSAGRLRDALARLNARLRREAQAGRQSALVVYYSGHADERALHLGSSSLPWDELRNLVSGSAAELRLLIVDACRSGRATRVKGTRVIAPFELPAPSAPLAEGFAILSSATQGEDAQESDTLQASFFTHYLVSALRGAGDADGDDRVTLDEAYRYARDRTVASTATTYAGVQHPTYKYDLRGRAKVVLTQLHGSRRSAVLRLPGAGRFFLHRGGPQGPIEVEVELPSSGGKVLLPPGRWFVRWRRPDRFYEGLVTAPAGRVTELDPDSLEAFEYGRLVRKGGGGAVAGVTVFGGAASTPTAGYPASWEIGLGASVELPTLTLDLVAAYARSDSLGPGLPARLHQATLLAGARKVFDLSPVALSFGLRLGAVFEVQTYSLATTAERRHISPAAELVARLDLPIGSGFFISAELAARGLLVEIEREASGAASETPLLGRGWLGVGALF